MLVINCVMTERNLQIDVEKEFHQKVVKRKKQTKRDVY